MKKYFIKLTILAICITCVGCSKTMNNSIGTQKEVFEKDLIEFIQKSVDYEDRLNDFLFDVDKIVLKNISAEDGRILLTGYSEAEGSYLDILEKDKKRIQNNSIDSRYKEVLDKTINFEELLINYYNSTNNQLTNNSNDYSTDIKNIQDKLEKEKKCIVKMLEDINI